MKRRKINIGQYRRAHTRSNTNHSKISTFGINRSGHHAFLLKSLWLVLEYFLARRVIPKTSSETQVLLFQFRAGQVVGNPHKMPKFISAESQQNSELHRRGSYPVKIECSWERHLDRNTDHWHDKDVFSHFPHDSIRVGRGCVEHVEHVD